MMLCDLLSIKRISGRPSSAPKLAMDTEFISGASRALAAMTLVRQAAASEIAVPSGIEHEEMDRWRRSTTVARQDNRGYHGLLQFLPVWYRYGGKLDESLRRSAPERKFWKRAMRSRHSDESHDHEARQDCALQV